MKDSGRQKDRQRWERKEWASLVEKHPRRVKASPWGRAPENLTHSTGHLQTSLFRISMQCMVTVILSNVMVQRTYSILAVIRVKTNS